MFLCSCRLLLKLTLDLSKQLCTVSSLAIVKFEPNYKDEVWYVKFREVPNKFQYSVWCIDVAVMAVVSKSALYIKTFDGFLLKCFKGCLLLLKIMFWIVDSKWLIWVYKINKGLCFRCLIHRFIINYNSNCH